MAQEWEVRSVGPPLKLNERWQTSIARHIAQHEDQHAVEIGKGAEHEKQGGNDTMSINQSLTGVVGMLRRKVSAGAPDIAGTDLVVITLSEAQKIVEALAALDHIRQAVALLGIKSEGL